MTDIRGSRVAVIGGAGFIGSHIVDQLTREDVREIVIYDNFCRGTRLNLERALTDDRVRIFEAGGDITQPDLLQAALDGCDYAFHLAALWLLQCQEFPRAAFKVNVEGTFNVLEACRDQNVKRLVYSSSASVYGNAVESPMTEDHPFNNRTFYGATKISGEAMCRAFYDRYDLDFVGLRYMNVYGPRQDYQGAYVSVIMKMLDRIDAGLPPIIYGDGSQSYDFVYVEDVARANIRALLSAQSDAFYNVGSGVSTTIKELAELILELTDSDLAIEYAPEGQTFVTERIGSTRKASTEIGYEYEISLREGLQRLIEWRAAAKASSEQTHSAVATS